MEVLYLRIMKLLKEKDSQKNNMKHRVYKLGNSDFDAYIQKLVIKGKVKPLTFTESELLEILCKKMNKLVKRRVILEEIWGRADYYTGRSLNVFISKLRSYLKNDPNVEIINSHGKGYKLSSSLVSS